MILVVLGSLRRQANSHLKYSSLKASFALLARFEPSEYCAVFELEPQNRIASDTLCLDLLASSLHRGLLFCCGFVGLEADISLLQSIGVEM